ncbi:DUF4365 domain-containing protein [Arthrobacter sp. zg-Y844]|uniref:DUF4365 domain-containing protein n=1 Tax=Arthrobacter sp. zg-Y844 TaxID=2964612 RepID=UPI002106F612|nr:DUF4365 domain-containing protein [Arthrobacter sp. zg-Y844]MCQ1988047.1 DUF4365 domain-containing protein [Arthrobacter sp. zg-Y844]
MTLSIAQHRGYHSGLQGHFAEQYVRALAGATGFSVGKRDPEPEGIDLAIGYTRRPDLPWGNTTIEVSVKSTHTPLYSSSGEFQYDIKAAHHDVLCGTYGIDFDIRRYLVVVAVPPKRQHFARMEKRRLILSNEAYFLDLMGTTPVGNSATKRRLSFPHANLLTPLTLAEVLFQDAGKALQWVSV